MKYVVETRKTCRRRKIAAAAAAALVVALPSPVRLWWEHEHHFGPIPPTTGTLQSHQVFRDIDGDGYLEVVNLPGAAVVASPNQ